MKKLLILLCFPIVGFSQGNLEADNEFKLQNYERAIELYEKQLSKAKQTTSTSDLKLKLANSYFLTKDYTNARKLYLEIYNAQGKNMDQTSFIRMISTIRSAGDHTRAKDLMNAYYGENAMREKVQNYQIAKLDSLKMEVKQFVNLGSNTAKSELGMTIMGTNAIFSQQSKSGDANYSQDFYNLMIAQRNESSGQLSNVKPFLSNINSDYNDATITFLRDNTTIFFSRNPLNKKDKLDAKDGEVAKVMIMKGNISGDRIENIEPAEFNEKNYNFSHPFLTSDGKHLLFVSDMPGGHGQSDIYIVEVFNDGSTGQPVNLGPTINTPGNELFPTMSGDTLYFASNFHVGFGGLDVFQAKMTGKTNFSIPENLGEPINSNADDFMYTLFSNRTGYINSDRAGGKGSDDIYWFKLSEIQKFIEFNGDILTKGDNTPIDSAKIDVYNQFNELVGTSYSDENGKFKLDLPLNSQLTLRFSKPEYSTEKLSLSTPLRPEAWKGRDVFLTSFASLVEKEGTVEKIKIDPIYFDYGKWDITPQAEAELAKIIYAMETFPNIRIKIESHTDSRGADKFNLKLSDNRAKSTMSYLISKGIEADRIESAIGYGETRPRNNCTNGVKCTEEEYFINRRSDFVVISK